jgi:hypothetical protein
LKLGEKPKGFSSQVIKRKEEEVYVYYSMGVRVSKQVAIYKGLYCGFSFLNLVGNIVGEYFIITRYEKGRAAVGAFYGVGAFFKVNDSTALTAFSGDENARGHTLFSLASSCREILNLQGG